MHVESLNRYRWREAEPNQKKRNLENFWFERRAEKAVQRFEAMNRSVSRKSSLLFLCFSVSAFDAILFELVADLRHFLSQFAAAEEEDVMLKAREFTLPSGYGC